MSVELLAPAGSREALIAAVQNGADAVYLGAQQLNARASAANFDRDGLRWACDYCHDRGVSVHVTVNTLLKQSEMPLLEDVASQLAFAGADAAIVQDLGAALALKAMLPTLKLHASTQMAIHNRQGVMLARQMGFQRAVLAREMSHDEIRACAGLGVELECFAHGALCVSCSGQCLFSSMVGGRSGNRGQCAQPCRLPYTLHGPVRGEGYLLSPRDLMTLYDLPALLDTGVCSLKIEGRLKRPEYVAVVTRVYRQALDRLAAGERVSPDAQEELKQIFNRGGFTRGYGPGLKDQELMSHSKPNHAGCPVGQVRDGRIALTRDVSTGDTLALRDGAGREYPVKGISGRAGDVIRTPLPAGMKAPIGLWRLVDESQMTQARLSAQGEHRLTEIRAAFCAHVGQEMRLSVTDGERTFTATGDVVARATGRPADRQRIRASLGKMDTFPYQLTDAALDVEDMAFLPVSAVNGVRREALQGLSNLRISAARGCEETPFPCPTAEEDDRPLPASITLRAQGADFSLLKAALAHGADEAVFAPENLADIEHVTPPFPVALALPDTLMGDDLDRLNRWAWARQASITAVYLSNAAHLSMTWPGERRLDAGLNIANRLALAVCGEAALYTPSVELNAADVLSLGAAHRRELIVYGRTRLMTLRHCPVLAQLGGMHIACHRCDQLPARDGLNGQSLIDRTGARFPLRRQKGGHGCMIKLYNSVPTMLLRHKAKIPPSASWRMIFTDETADMAVSITRLYHLARLGEDFTSASEWAELQTMKTTTGHLLRGV